MFVLQLDPWAGTALMIKMRSEEARGNRVVLLPLVFVSLAQILRLPNLLLANTTSKVT